ncbi:MAG: hypothetical protein EA408_01490 [Marinilabiliales bacterium]|nr:MAG: hypothetical protein EA408_01490 [Marinilabiliales bacterium]
MFFCIFAFALLYGATPVKAVNPVIGEWAFSADQAPWEYSRGRIVIELDEEEALAGKLLFDSGIEVRITRITRDEEKVVMDIYIEGYLVRTVVELKDDELKGITETPDGNIPFSAKRYVPEE